jgi:hypothetical protein
MPLIINLSHIRGCLMTSRRRQVTSASPISDIKWFVHIGVSGIISQNSPTFEAGPRGRRSRFAFPDDRSGAILAKTGMLLREDVPSMLEK